MDEAGGWDSNISSAILCTEREDMDFHEEQQINQSHIKQNAESGYLKVPRIRGRKKEPSEK